MVKLLQTTIGTVPGPLMAGGLLAAIGAVGVVTALLLLTAGLVGWLR
jgi:hypothetical protein